MRFGGDEFAIVFAEGTGYERPGRRCAKVVHAVEAPIADRRGAHNHRRRQRGSGDRGAGDVQRLADQALYDANVSAVRP